ncbi:hypothetical protein PBY51_016396 [Eleginops maclovinus]|uniref:Uncharacterized protein n=1 Tax=Eleginops maclovinus TaxID=56733 RepID=A0AAN8AS47_ELEMC|nr:hypothetical protein PBY51_016396 [Eleginops maclovinus]
MPEQFKNRTATKERQKNRSQTEKHGQREPFQSSDSSDDDVPRAQYWLRVSRPAKSQSPHTTLPYVPQRYTVTSPSSHEQARLITPTGEAIRQLRITPEEHVLMEQDQSSEQEFEQKNDNEYEQTAGSDHAQDTENQHQNGPARCDIDNDRSTTPLCESARRPVRDRRPPKTLTYESLGQPSYQSQGSVNTVGLFGAQTLPPWGMPTVPMAHYTPYYALYQSLPYPVMMPYTVPSFAY